MGRERRGQQQRGRMSDPNMTPLIDLTFLLLITFIITFPMLEQGISIKLPRGKTEKIEQNKSQSISTTARSRPTNLKTNSSSWPSRIRSRRSSCGATSASSTAS